MKKIFAVLLICVLFVSSGCASVVKSPTGQTDQASGTGQPQPKNPYDQYSPQVR